MVSVVTTGSAAPTSKLIAMRHVAKHPTIRFEWTSFVRYLGFMLGCNILSFALLPTSILPSVIEREGASPILLSLESDCEFKLNYLEKPRENAFIPFKSA
jgi:hypothetical protein